MKPRHLINASFLVGLAATLPIPLLHAGTTVIDQYTDAFELDAGTASNTTVTTGTISGLAGVQGGIRNVTLTETQAPGGTQGLVSTGNPNNLYFSTGASASGSSNGLLSLAYGYTATTSAQMNLNLTGSNAFGLAVIRGDFTQSSNAETLTIQVTSGAGTSSQATRSATINLVGTVGTTELIPFSSFGGVNFADVDGIATNFQVTSGSPDTQFGVFQAVSVPEPSTWALLGAGAAGLGLVTLRRRRRPAGV